MSDSSQGEGWWQASDGKWYPPEQASSLPVPPAPPTSPGVPTVDTDDDTTTTTPGATTPDATTPSTTQQIPTSTAPTTTAFAEGCSYAGVDDVRFVTATAFFEAARPQERFRVEDDTFENLPDPGDRASRLRRAPDGVRFDTSTAFVDVVAAGESVRVEEDTVTDVPSWVDESELSCEVLDVEDFGF